MAKPSRTLLGHTDDVLTAFSALYGSENRPTEFARRWLAFFKLGESEMTPFLRNARLACRVHDWGKANTGFAGMLTGKGGQLVRHEVVSALIMMQPGVWDWLSAAEGVDLPLVLAGVAGHHLKAAEPVSFEDTLEFGATQAHATSKDFALTWGHPKVRASLADLAAEVGLTTALPNEVPRLWSINPRAGMSNYRDGRDRACSLLRDFQREIQGPASPRARMLRAVRSALIASDSAGSALFRTHEEAGRGDDVHEHVRRWIGEAFDEGAKLDEAKVWDAVINPRTEQLALKQARFEARDA